jgi:hypothetical protein
MNLLDIYTINSNSTIKMKDRNKIGQCSNPGVDAKMGAELPKMPKMPKMLQLFAMDLVPGKMSWCARVTSRKLSLRYSLHLSTILFASRIGDSLFDVVSRWPLHMTAGLDSSKLQASCISLVGASKGTPKE